MFLGTKPIGQAIVDRFSNPSLFIVKRTITTTTYRALVKTTFFAGEFKIVIKQPAALEALET